jgi:hypothetical protein
MEETDLQGAQLINTELHSVVFRNVNLLETNFLGANFSHTIVSRSDLSKAHNINNATHSGPSTIGFESLLLSGGQIPEEFLRGCGLSDLDIQYAKLANHNLTPDQVTDITYKIHDLYRGGGSIQYYSLYISYSTKDELFAQKLHDDFQDNGVRCWFAPHDIQAGKKIYEQIDRAIQHHDRLLLILSDHSMNSEWVKSEIANARQKEIVQGRQVLFPISIVDYEQIKKWKCFDADAGKDSAREIREYFIPDFSNWQDEDAYKVAFERLLRDLKATGGE